MCFELIVRCKHCGYSRHYSWKHCDDYRVDLQHACEMGIDTPSPAECEREPAENRVRVQRDMTPYECPVESCPSTQIAKDLFVKRAKAEAEAKAAMEKAQREFEAKDKAKKDRFARRYFRKLPLYEYAPRRFLDEMSEEERQRLTGAADETTAEGSDAKNDNESDDDLEPPPELLVECVDLKLPTIVVSSLYENPDDETGAAEASSQAK